MKTTILHTIDHSDKATARTLEVLVEGTSIQVEQRWSRRETHHEVVTMLSKEEAIALAKALLEAATR